MVNVRNTIQQWRLSRSVDILRLKGLDINDKLKLVLLRRGIDSIKDAKEFLDPGLLPDPKKHFKDLDKAIKRIKDCSLNSEKIVICGDYDADGMTSTALIKNVLTELKCDVECIIPNRLEEGYGLNINMINKCIELSVRVIITVDNGVSSIEALNRAYQNNIDVIVTDHHKIDQSLDNIFALLHPDNTPDNSPYKSLAGVGIAFILAKTICLEYGLEEIIPTCLDLFCIGTIADVAYLKGANRYYLLKGLSKLSETKNLGIECLLEINHLRDTNVNSEDIGFKIAPIINAVGRIGEPKDVLNLLTENDKDVALSIANKCNKLNLARKTMTEQIENEALQLLNADKFITPKFILIAQTHWHPGIIGIVASRLVEKFNKPTAILAPDKHGRFRGSVRSPKWFQVDVALKSCKKVLESFGGHSAAGGFTVESKNIGKLNQLLVSEASKQYNKDNDYTIVPEAYLDFTSINDQFWQDHQKLEPFGMGNERPLFWTKNCKVIRKRIIRDKHLKLTLENSNIILEAIYWNITNEYDLSNNIDIAYTIKKSIWKGNIYFQLELKSIRPYNEVTMIQVRERIYKCYVNKENNIEIINQKNEVLIASLNNGSITCNSLLNKEGKYIQSLVSSAKTALGFEQ